MSAKEKTEIMTPIEYLKMKKIPKPTYEGVRLVDEGMSAFRIVNLLAEYVTIVREQDAANNASKCNLQNVSFSEERAEVCKCGSKNMFVDEGKLYCSDCRKLADVHLQT